MAGKYTREREIGRGGMGAVWLGHDTVLDRAVALKRVGMVPGGSTPDLERAEREARLAAALNHPHVVAVFDLVAEGDEHWLVMEYVEGASLADLVRQHGPMSPQEAASVLWQTADALAAAHGAGIVHRDVKPSNILVTPDGDAKLTDFGIARAEADASLTQTGLVTGSPAYLSPEVASGRPATPASDVWALGATLFHTLAGRPPYDVGDNVLGAMYQIVHEEPPRLPNAGWLAPLLEHTMATDPADRWPTDKVRDFLREGAGGTPPVVPTAPLQAAAVPVPPAPSDPGTPAQDDARTTVQPVGGSSPRGRWTDRRNWPWVAAAVAVLLMTVYAFSLGLSSGGDRGDDGTAAPASQTPTAEPEPSASPSPEESSPTPEPAPTTSAPASPTTPDPAAMESFVAGYLDTVTSDPKATFAMLTPAFQAESGGYGRYKGFWSTIEDATLQEVEADPEAMTVTYTVTYDLAAGGQTTEQVTLFLEQSGNGFKVAAES